MEKDKNHHEKINRSHYDYLDQSGGFKSSHSIDCSPIRTTG
jgi:hypothetical protein